MMFSLKALVLALMMMFALNGAESCDAKRSGARNSNGATKSSSPVNSNAPVNSQPEVQDEGVQRAPLKILAQGQQSGVSNAFILVVRDAETYKALRGLVQNLPGVDEEFFNSNLVAAAFLGERRTGGYGVQLKLAGNATLRLEETKPPKDAMVTQALTTPFAVAVLPVKTQESLAIDAGDAWREALRPYKVTEGEFTMAGGFAGRSEKFELVGSIGLMRERKLVTLLFDLESKGGEPRRLVDAASGVIQQDGRLTIGHMGAGSLVTQPAAALNATVAFAESERVLSLIFGSIPGRVADGYGGTGSLKAEATAPAPQKRKSSTKDAPQ